MRMYGRLALHAESVVMPLLVPDVPVVTWWHGEPPERIANDFLGVVADRRITDCAQAARPDRRRCGSGPPTTRPATPTWPGPGSPRGARWWRARSTPPTTTVVGATVVAPPTDPTAALMAGWLASRLHITPRWEDTTEYPRMRCGRS